MSARPQRLSQDQSRYQGQRQVALTSSGNTNTTYRNHLTPLAAKQKQLQPNFSSADMTTRKNLDPDNLDPGNLDLMVILALSFILLVASAITGVFIAYPLLAALLMLVAALLRRGFVLSQLIKMGLAGAKQALPVVYILLLISILTAVWMAAGTVPALVYYGTQLISPHFFILWAFLLSSGLSILLGTSFGTVGTIGVALMVIAHSSHIAANPVAGAIIAGAFVGDRCSPLSSSAHLVATITQTDLYANLRNMLASSLWPLTLSALFYAGLSVYLYHPESSIQTADVQTASNAIATELPNAFNLSLLSLLPAAIILLLALLKVNVKLAMLASIGSGIAIAHSLQQVPLLALFKFALLGYQTNNSALQNILIGGGLLPMAKTSVAVFISTAFAGIFSGSRILAFASAQLQHIRTYRQLSCATAIVSIFANLFGCTQTIGILLTEQIMRPCYQQYYQEQRSEQYSEQQYSKQQYSKQQAYQQQHAKPTANQQLAIAIEDTAVVTAPLIPWNIAGLIPATILTVGPGCIPYMAYLILLPLFSVIRARSPILGKAKAPLAKTSLTVERNAHKNA